MNINSFIPIPYKYGPPLPRGIAALLPRTGFWPWVVTGVNATVRVAPSSGLGDVNMDGYVDAADIALVEKMILGTITPTAEQIRRSNLRGDGSLDMGIATMMENYITGRINSFPGG